MYIVTWTDDSDWLSCWIVGSYKTKASAKTAMVECATYDIVNELDDDNDDTIAMVRKSIIKDKQIIGAEYRQFENTIRILAYGEHTILYTLHKI